MGVILLDGGQQHVSATHVAIIKLVITKTQLQLICV
jgi:hypothetical protein